MWDIGPYAIHTLRQCFGTEPAAATAIAKYNDSGADVTMSGVLDFGDGRHGPSTESDCARITRRSPHQLEAQRMSWPRLASCVEIADWFAW